MNNELNDPNLGFPLAPRFDLREPAFRKYEQYIADACNNGTFTITPRLPDKGGNLKLVKAKTFISRFSDAKLAFVKYGYQSELIPVNYDLSVIKAKELEDGRVVIINLKKEQEKVSEAKYIRVSDLTKRPALMALIEEVNLHKKKGETYLEKFVTCVSDDEFNLLETLVEPTEVIAKRTTGTIARLN